MARRAERQRVRTNKMLVSVVAVFALTWTPFHVHSVIAEFRHDLVLGLLIPLPPPSHRLDCIPAGLAGRSRYSSTITAHNRNQTPIGGASFVSRPRARSFLQARRRALPSRRVQLRLRQPGRPVVQCIGLTATIDLSAFETQEIHLHA